MESSYSGLSQSTETLTKMRIMRCILFIAMVISGSHCFLVDTPRELKWDNLRVTWGLDTHSPNYFSPLPRTVTDAIHAGFKKIGDCSVLAHWRGQRFVKNDDYSLILLYDIHGFIAGIQTAVPIETGRNYPNSSLTPPFVRDGHRWVISAYFVPPSIICSRGRSQAEFDAEGTGTDLYIQNGTVPENSFIVPHKEVGLSHSKWVEGHCFFAMGKHFWYDLRADSDCNALFPVFLLYNNKGELTAFGWAMVTNLVSTRYEHPSPISFGLFIKD
ncbi:hypothetical protein Bpfe_005683 [Biomphalaria pfeifferi]|uniref:Uncharacterized protein n=1 Tax=Biomphalaria pfeifferi TaxID=112525 RepID=A0AAD8C2S4_BIOPF|nr:hypothetical protein Bpfe_005683 [Biomphalaria pfeifferi]